MIRPRADSVRALDNYEILIHFNNGETRKFDVKPYLSDHFFEKLRNHAVFKQVHTNDMSVEWPFEIDICPDELYYDSVEYKS